MSQKGNSLFLETESTMSHKQLIITILLTISYQVKSQYFFEFADLSYDLDFKTESIGKIDILKEECLPQTNPFFLVEHFRKYGIDSKKNKIKSVQSKHFYSEFDSLGKITSIGYNKKKAIEYFYDEYGMLKKIKGVFFPSFEPFIYEFIVDSMNRISLKNVTRYNTSFSEKPIDEFYSEYQYDKFNNIIRKFQMVIPAKNSVTGKDYKYSPEEYLYNKDNRIIKSHTDSILYYSDSIVKYTASHKFSYQLKRNIKIVDKWVYFFQKNNIIRIEVNNKPYKSRKFDTNDNLLEEITTTTDQFGSQTSNSILVSRYYPDGRIISDDLIYNSSGMLQEYLYKDKKHKINYTFY